MLALLVIIVLPLCTAVRPVLDGCGDNDDLAVRIRLTDVKVPVAEDLRVALREHTRTLLSCPTWDNVHTQVQMLDTHEFQLDVDIPSNVVVDHYATRLRALFLPDSEVAEVVASGYTWNAPTKPHIFLFISDDQGWEDVGWRIRNEPSSPTPYLDSMMPESAELMYLITAPICSPSRSMLWTGRFTHRHGYGPSINNGWTTQLSGRETLIPEILKGAGGYHNAIFEKWHMGLSDRRNGPLKRGFDNFIGALSLDYLERDNELNANKASDTIKLKDEYKIANGITLFNDTIVPGVKVSALGADEQTPYTPGGDIETMHNADIVEQEAIRLLENFVADETTRNKPLFFNIGSRQPHEPLVPPTRYSSAPLKDLFVGATNGRNYLEPGPRKEYLKMVHSMDAMMGAVIDTFKDLGLWGDTVFIFTSDNGGLSNKLGSASNWPLQGRKNLLHLGGVRVVSTVHGTASKLAPLSDAAKGQKNNDLLHFVDWLPTICTGLAGIRPEDYDKAWKCDECVPHQYNELDGVNQWDNIAGNLGHVINSTRVMATQVISERQADLMDATDQELGNAIERAAWDPFAFENSSYADHIDIAASQAFTLNDIRNTIRFWGGGQVFYGKYVLIFEAYGEETGKPHYNQAKTVDKTVALSSNGDKRDYSVLGYAAPRGHANTNAFFYDMYADEGQDNNLLRFGNSMEQEHKDAFEIMYNEYVKQQGYDYAMIDYQMINGWGLDPAMPVRISQTGKWIPWCDISIMCYHDVPVVRSGLAVTTGPTHAPTLRPTVVQTTRAPTNEPTKRRRKRKRKRKRSKRYAAAGSAASAAVTGAAMVFFGL